MKNAIKIGAVALASNAVVSCAMAGGLYAGVDMGVANVPDFTFQVIQTMRNSGFTSATDSQNKGSGTGGIYGGQWVTEYFGWEAEILSLGSINGNVAASNAGGVVLTSYSYSTGALTAAVLGGLPIGASGKVYLKGGAYGASVTYNGPTSTVTRTSAGGVLGLGFSYQFTRHIVGKVDAANYFGVKYPAYEFFTPSVVNTRTDIRVGSIGAAYLF